MNIEDDDEYLKSLYVWKKIFLLLAVISGIVFIFVPVVVILITNITDPVILLIMTFGVALVSYCLICKMNIHMSMCFTMIDDQIVECFTTHEKSIKDELDKIKNHLGVKK